MEVVEEVSVELTGCSGRAAAAAHEITEGEMVTRTMAFTQGGMMLIRLPNFNHTLCHKFRNEWGGGGLGDNPSPDSFLGLAEVVEEASVELTGCSGRAAAAAHEITQCETVTRTMNEVLHSGSCFNGRLFLKLDVRQSRIEIEYYSVIVKQ